MKEPYSLTHAPAVSLSRLRISNQKSNSFKCYFVVKLDGLGPVDNIPSTTTLKHFVWKKLIKQIHVTGYMWQVRRDMWHVTCDIWHLEGGEPSLNVQLHNFYGLGVKVCWRYCHMGWATKCIKEGMTNVFVEQPRLHWVLSQWNINLVSYAKVVYLKMSFDIQIYQTLCQDVVLF